MNYISGRVNELNDKVNTAEQAQESELNKMKVKLSENYTTKQEFMRFVDVIFAKIDQSNNKLDQKIDRFDQKFDQLVQALNDKKDRNE